MIKKLKTLFRISPNKTFQVKVIRRDVCKLTLAEFRSDPAMTSAAAATLRSDYAVLMVQVLKNEHPSNYIQLNADIPTRAMMQARAEGYTLAIANLEAMAVHQKPSPGLTATFEAEDNQTSTQD